jgi:pyrimidine-specific ribonucleoside hydrolase
MKVGPLAISSSQIFIPLQQLVFEFSPIGQLGGWTMKTKHIMLILGILLVGCSAPAASPTLLPEETDAATISLQPEDTRRYVVIDADMGEDSVMEILYLLQVEDVAVKAITVVGTGLAHCQPGMRTVLGLLALTGDEHIPVACGREKPLQGEVTFPQDWRSQMDSLAETLDLPAGGEPANMNAVDLLINAIEAAPHKATLLAEGPLTNLAEALQAKPELVDQIEMVYIMGGALEVPGNVEEQPSAEWNIYADPYAANQVFRSGVPVTLVPLDATNQVPTTERSYLAFEQNHATPAAEVVYDLMRNSPYLYSGGGNYFWDPLAAAILTDPSLATIETVRVEVVESGDDIGRTRVSEQGSSIQVARSPDSERFLMTFLSVLNGGAAVELFQMEEEIEAVEIGSFFISAKTCEYDGLSEIPAGKVSLDITAEPQGIDNAMVVGTVDEGKGIDDLVAWDKCDQPPWFNVVSFYETSGANEEQKELVFTVGEGSIYMVCFEDTDPCDQVNQIGPIEVR